MWNPKKVNILKLPQLKKAPCFFREPFYALRWCLVKVYAVIKSPNAVPATDRITSIFSMLPALPFYSTRREIALV